jgi:hypothetical protein
MPAAKLKDQNPQAKPTALHSIPSFWALCLRTKSELSAVPHPHRDPNPTARSISRTAQLTDKQEALTDDKTYF